MASKASDKKKPSKPSSRNEKKRSNAKFAKARRSQSGGKPAKKPVLSVGQDSSAFPSLGKIDYELIAEGLTPVAVWNQTLKGWSVLYAEGEEFTGALMARGLPLHLAVQKLPTQAQRQETLRQKRNYAAWRRLPPSVREQINDPQTAESQSDWWDALGDEYRELIKAAQSAMKSKAKKGKRN